MFARKDYLLPLLLTALSLLLTVLSSTILVSPLRSAVSSFYTSVNTGFYHLGLSLREEITFWQNLRRFADKNRTLLKNLKKLRAELVLLKEVKKENDFLREQLKITGENADFGRQVLANVSGTSSGGSKWIIIDRGKKSGLKEGSVVIVKNYLVGVAFEVENNSSKITLITDPEVSLSALDQDSPTRSRGVVTGLFGSQLKMEKILPEEQVAVGDTIITSGLDQKYPRGLIIGEVEKVFESSSGALKSARIKPVIDFNRLEQVFVILP